MRHPTDAKTRSMKHPHLDLINDNMIDLFLFVDLTFERNKRAQGLAHQLMLNTSLN